MITDSSVGNFKGNKLLVLKRDRNESLRLGEEITVTVLRVDKSSVALAIHAPSNVIIARSEIYKGIVERNNRDVLDVLRKKKV